MVKRYEAFASLCFLSVFKSKVPRKSKVSRKAQEVSSKKPIQTIRTKKAEKLIEMNFSMLPLSGSRRVFQTSIKCKRNILDPAKAGVFYFFNIKSIMFNKKCTNNKFVCIMIRSPITFIAWLLSFSTNKTGLAFLV